MLKLFSKPTPPEHSSTVEERREELRTQLTAVSAEISELMERWRSFRLVHRVLLDRKVRLCGDSMQGEQLRLEEEAFAQRMSTLTAESSALQEELSRLMTNPGETVHVAGQLVDAR